MEAAASQIGRAAETAKQIKGSSRAVMPEADWRGSSMFKIVDINGVHHKGHLGCSLVIPNSVQWLHGSFTSERTNVL